MGWENTQVQCQVCGAWSTLPSDFFPDEARSQIYRGLQCLNCDNVTLLLYTPSRGVDVVEASSTYSMGEQMFGYFFPPFANMPIGIIPIEEMRARVREGATKQRKPTKRNKRRWKIIYKGKLSDDESHIRHPDPNRKTKKDIQR
jgi:hypothetical protein